jgi:hypothetical protein
MPNDETPPPPTHSTLIKIAPFDIVLSEDFRFRGAFRPDASMVRVLAQRVRTSGRLDPVLLWQEQDADGVTSGRLLLLDGRHRLAAYRSAWKSDRKVPAVVLHCTRHHALLAAVRANTRETLPLTAQERADAAWRLVRAPEGFTVRETSEASGVSPRTVDNMRKRAKEMNASGREPTGTWWRDKQDHNGEIDEKPEMTDQQRQALVERMAKEIKAVLGKTPWQDLNLVGEVFAAAVGYQRHRQIAEYLHGNNGEDDWSYDEPVRLSTGATDEDSDGDF